MTCSAVPQSIRLLLPPALHRERLKPGAVPGWGWIVSAGTGHPGRLTRYVEWLTAQEEDYAPDPMDGWLSPIWFRVHIPESEFVPDFCQRLHKTAPVAVVYGDPIV